MRIVLLISLVTLLVGCQDVKRPEKPENLISKTKMVDILTDAYIGNATRSIDNRRLRSEGVFLDSILYKKYKIDSLQFATSNAYYTSDLDQYTKLLRKVEAQLVVRKKLADSLYKLEKEERERKRDSTKQADSLKTVPLIKAPKGKLIPPVQDIEE